MMSQLPLSGIQIWVLLPMELVYSHKLPPCKQNAQDDDNNNLWLYETLLRLLLLKGSHCNTGNFWKKKNKIETPAIVSSSIPR